MSEETRPSLPEDCACAESMRPACHGPLDYENAEGKKYCVLHFLGEKSNDFKKALQSKLKSKNFNFCGAIFPDEVDFSSLNFNTKADFSKATFVKNVYFSSATFKNVNFHKTIFGGEAYFDNTTFDGLAIFVNAEFHAKASFKRTYFKSSKRVFFFEAVFIKESVFRDTRFGSPANSNPAKFEKAPPVKSKFFKKVEFITPGFDKNAEANFRNAIFEKEAGFRKAKFKGKADFSSSIFTEADFRDATFKEADFSHTRFITEASFSYTTFEAKADFSSSAFNTLAYFFQVTFGTEANFSYALFGSHVKFAGDEKGQSFGLKEDKNEQGFAREPSLDFQHARIDNPNRVSFYALKLFPHWFVNVDVRKLDFINVEWVGEISEEISNLTKKQEISTPTKKDILPPNLLLAVTYRQIAINAEENHRYDEASKYRYRAMELQPEWGKYDIEFLDNWKKRLSKLFKAFSEHRFITFFKQNWLYWLYRLASGYGERVSRAFLLLVLIWVLFAWAYTWTEFMQPDLKFAQGTDEARLLQDEKYPLQDTKRALIYSLAVMSLQKPEPHPLTNTGHTLVMLETILGPVQTALLLLAIRRKFMR